jgi:DNA-binding CsgD family transcriptional regulator
MRDQGEQDGQALALARDAADLGQALAALLEQRCCGRYLALWSQRSRDGGLELVHLSGTAPDQVQSRLLVVGARAVGRLDVDLTAVATPGLSPYLEALLPWLAVTLLRCAGSPALSALPGLPAREAEASARADACARKLRLTQRERDVLERLLLGEANKEIAVALGISPRTVEVYVSRVLQKTGMDSSKTLIVRLWAEPGPDAASRAAAASA